MKKIKLAILGSTGSVGQNTLEVVRNHPDRFEVIGLSAWNNYKILAKQVKEFAPQMVAVGTSEVYEKYNATTNEDLKRNQQIPNKFPTQIGVGNDAICEIATMEKADIIVSAIVGLAGIKPGFAALKAGKNLALANKESLAVAGKLMMDTAAENDAKIIPVDSELSAFFQCLQGSRTEDIERFYLTASGGPFLRYTDTQMIDITPKMAVNHPVWPMGKKISVDSATLFNKGLELAETRWLFDVEPEKVEILIHPQCKVHGMIGFRDASVIAALAEPDMKQPIAYALSYPEKLNSTHKRLDFLEAQNWHFEKPDYNRFGALNLVKKALYSTNGAMAVLNAANEVAVDRFLNKKISFADIYKVNKSCLDQMEKDNVGRDIDSLDDILDIDKWARNTAKSIC